MNDKEQPESNPESNPEIVYEEEVDFPDRVPFTKEEFINSEALRNTSFKAEILKDVEDALLYESAKRGLRELINNYLNSTWILANFEKGDRNSFGKIDETRMAQITFELDLILSTASFTKSDVNSSDMLNITNALRSHFMLPILSRAKGPNRERIINKTTSMEQIITRRTESKDQKPERKKGIL